MLAKSGPGPLPIYRWTGAAYILHTLDNSFLPGLPMTPEDFDFLIVGAGIAGLSAAAGLSALGGVALIEREQTPCYHSSGRSAAMFARHYGSPAIQALTGASERLLDKAAADGMFKALAPAARGILFVAPTGYSGDSEPNAGQRRITPAEVNELVPILPAARIDHGLWDDSAWDIDVHAMHLGYARLLRERGGQILTGGELTQASYTGGMWEVTAGAARLRAPVIVNAAGAWADEVAALCGVAPLGIEPRRRSAALIDPPAVENGRRPVSGWPLVFDMDQTLYFKPEGGKLMLSPVDATPVAPHDCWAEDMDIAVAVDRFERLTGQTVQRVTHNWAGLRNFAPDGEPVIGADPSTPGFWWLAAQGGSGIKIAAAASALLVVSVSGEALPEGIGSELAARISPARFRAEGQLGTTTPPAAALES